MDAQTRQWFDSLLEEVLQEMPPLVHQLLEQVPLHVEDHPPPHVLREHGVRFRDELCGRYTGIPLTQKSVEHSGALPDVVTIYREGILAAAADRYGRVTPNRLRKQIRITILHELGHHHGLSEEDLRELGYE